MSSVAEKIAFNRAPLTVVDGIEVFSGADRYNENYEKIARDHLAAMRPGVDNPFIGDELWASLDASTRDLLIKHLVRGSSILDVGVGLGRVLAGVPQFDRYGVDISLDYLRKAREAGVAVAQARVEALPFADSSFDAVMACDVLEHVLDLHQSCSELIRVLKPGGTLIVRVPFKECLDVYLRNDLPYEFVHLRNFDEASLRLNFCKVFGMEFIEASEVAPYLQGSPRLRLRLLKEPILAELSRVATANRRDFKAIAPALEVSEAVFEKWIYDLKEKRPTIFAQVVRQFVMGIEINAVFRKAK